MKWSIRCIFKNREHRHLIKTDRGWESWWGSRDNKNLMLFDDINECYKYRMDEPLAYFIKKNYAEYIVEEVKEYLV